MAKEEIKPEDIRFIEQPYQKISVKQDDVIVISIPATMSGEHFAFYENLLKKVFPENEVLFLEDIIKIGVVEKSVPTEVMST